MCMLSVARSRIVNIFTSFPKKATFHTWRSPVDPGMEYSPGPTSAVLCTNKSGRFPVPNPTPL